MDADEFRRRTQHFALEVIGLTERLPRSRVADVLGRQLLRSGTSVGANYRSATRAQSSAHMVSKLAIVEEEADECIYWLELLVQSGIVTVDSVHELRREASQIVAMTVASKKTLKARARLSKDRQSKIVNRKSDGSQSTTGGPPE
jgi:four helix bundle protein